LRHRTRQGDSRPAYAVPVARNYGAATLLQPRHALRTRGRVLAAHADGNTQGEEEGDAAPRLLPIFNLWMACQLRHLRRLNEDISLIKRLHCML